MTVNFNKVPAFGFESQNCCHSVQGDSKKHIKSSITFRNLIKVVSYFPLVSLISGIALIVFAAEKNSILSKSFVARGLLQITCPPLLFLIDVVVTAVRQYKIASQEKRLQLFEQQNLNNQSI